MAKLITLSRFETIINNHTNKLDEIRRDFTAVIGFAVYHLYKSGNDKPMLHLQASAGKMTKMCGEIIKSCTMLDRKNINKDPSITHDKALEMALQHVMPHIISHHESLEAAKARRAANKAKRDQFKPTEPSVKTGQPPKQDAAGKMDPKTIKPSELKSIKLADALFIGETEHVLTSAESAELLRVLNAMRKGSTVVLRKPKAA